MYLLQILYHVFQSFIIYNFLFASQNAVRILSARRMNDISRLRCFILSGVLSEGNAFYFTRSCRPFPCQTRLTRWFTTLCESFMAASYWASLISSLTVQTPAGDMIRNSAGDDDRGAQEGIVELWKGSIKFLQTTCLVQAYRARFRDSRLRFGHGAVW